MQIPHVSGSIRNALLALIVYAGLPVIGAQGADPASKAKVYVDDDYGFRVTYPGGGWERGTVGAVAVPGELCRCWSKEGIRTINVFRQNPGKAFTPRFLVDESAKSMETQLGVQVKQKEVRTVGGMKAMWLVLTGKGTGGAIDGQGSVQTSQHWVAIPREKDVIVLLLTTADTNFAEDEKTFDAMLKTLEISGKQTDEQRASK